MDFSKMKFKKGTEIISKSIVHGGVFHYKLVVDMSLGDRDTYRLLNIKSHNIMDGFSSKNPKDVIAYLRSAYMNHEILEVLNYDVINTPNKQVDMPLDKAVLITLE
ncbi:hypothetical protein JR311_20120 (plasmid) [Bacillus velezensis]|uniref:hypothetical protein n=1 Tax=Bacillus velezensis TaxID=492670 RepID=UPI00049ED6B0|nr:hypothetical protein [Bacillus velezensis]KDN89935.1 hypothetical protein EF87_21165 [Bacillus amyloliquefaciens]QRV11333.1 hypothetical protein JR311_20120 [Bacillus velezensis]URJ76402.1 hypothetical protein MF619_004147 [Bacillus velezensis]URJ80358.1 hypothetical protein MF621_004109 [Bacillus velezensis]